ncbi:SdpI family protein [Chryseolinea soli]|uniref:SdpI family protein n=1 Tax=Chryseolinea soli TaxID=2321403 RepID=A0A385SQ47_9BACT|nr:SdpI family protein [Chryseolinea soli]AYB32377.1 SdpI family protein [Chryseolinea soli]
MGSYLVAGLAILVVGLIVKYTNVRRNYWLGYRTPRSMKSPAHWAFTNQRTARYAIAIGILSDLIGIVFWYYKVDSIYLVLFTLMLLLAAIIEVEVALYKFDKQGRKE